MYCPSTSKNIFKFSVFLSIYLFKRGDFFISTNIYFFPFLFSFSKQHTLTDILKVNYFFLRILKKAFGYCPIFLTSCQEMSPNIDNFYFSTLYSSFPMVITQKCQFLYEIKYYDWPLSRLTVSVTAFFFFFLQPT